MKNLTDIISESSIEQIDEKKGQQISKKALKEFVENNEYMLVVQKYHMEMYTEDRLYTCVPTETYIIEAGDDTIASKYGQAKYSSDSLSGQDIDGTWNNTDSQAVLTELANRTGFKCDKSYNPYHEDGYQVWFYRSEWLVKFMTKQKVFDTRTLIKS